MNGINLKESSRTVASEKLVRNVSDSSSRKFIFQRGRMKQNSHRGTGREQGMEEDGRKALESKSSKRSQKMGAGNRRVQAPGRVAGGELVAKTSR